MNGFEQIDRRADAHEVARKILRKQGRRQFAEVFALGFGFADGQSADGEAVERQLL